MPDPRFYTSMTLEQVDAYHHEQLAQRGIHPADLTALKSGMSWSMVYQLYGLLLKDGPIVIQIAKAIINLKTSNEPITMAAIVALINEHSQNVNMVIQDVLAILGYTSS